MSDSEAPAKVPDDYEKDVYYSRRWIQESVEAFEGADTDKSGFLSKAEILALLIKEYPDLKSKITDSHMDKIFKKFDYNDDKKLSVSEFIEFDMEWDAQIFDYYNAIVV